MPEYFVSPQATQETLRFLRDHRKVQMKGIWVVVALLVPVARSEAVRLGRAAVGSVPAGWSVARTHAGAPPHWEIIRDDSAPRPPYVLAQTSRDETAGRFPLAIWDRTAIRDGEVSVAFKAVA